MCQAPGVPGSYSRARGPAWSPARLRSQAPAAERVRRLMPHALACLAARMPSAGARGSLCASAPHHPAAQARRVPAYQAGTRSESPQHWPASLLQTATFTSYSFHTQRRWLTSPLPGWASYPTGCKALRSSGGTLPAKAVPQVHRHLRTEGGQDSERAEAALLWHGPARRCWQRRGRRRGIQ